MEKTALLIIDMQNDNISPGGANENSGSVQHAKEQNLIENVQSIVCKARENEIPIIHAYFVVEKGAPTLKNNAPILFIRALKKVELFKKVVGVSNL